MHPLWAEQMQQNRPQTLCVCVNIYRCISINYNVVEKFIYFSDSIQIVKLVY